MLFRAAIVLGTAAVATPAAADALQDQIVAQARSATATHSYTRTITTSQSDGKTRTVVHRYDPRLPAKQRWVFVSADGKAPTPDEQRKAERRNGAGKGNNYATLADWFGAPATRSDAGAGKVRYRFARLPKGAVKVGPSDISDAIAADAIVNVAGATPFVESVRMTTTRPLRMMMVARLASMELNQRYQRLPSGAVVETGGDSVMAGSMMGKSGTVRSVARYTDYAPVR